MSACVCVFLYMIFFDRLFLLLLLLLLCFWSLILNKAHIGLMFRISSLNAIFPTSSFIPVYFGDLLCMLYVRISTMCTTNSTHNTNIRAWNCFFMSMCVCVCVRKCWMCCKQAHVCCFEVSLSMDVCCFFHILFYSVLLHVMPPLLKLWSAFTAFFRFVCDFILYFTRSERCFSSLFYMFVSALQMHVYVCMCRNLFIGMLSSKSVCRCFSFFYYCTLHFNSHTYIITTLKCVYYILFSHFIVCMCVCMCDCCQYTHTGTKCEPHTDLLKCDSII